MYKKLILKLVYFTKIANKAIDIYLEQDAMEKMFAREACRLDQEDFVFDNIFQHRIVDSRFPQSLQQ